MLQQLPDNDLMQRIKSGDAAAFRLLVLKHLPKSHAIARRLLHVHQDAEEATQDAFTKVWVHAARFDARQAAFGTWFYRILTRTCLDMLRKRPIPHSDISDMQDSLADPSRSQESSLSSQQEAARIQKAVQSLPEKQRLAVVLCYFEGMTNPEAAEIMQLHIKALEGLLVRARKQLRVTLGDL